MEMHAEFAAAPGQRVWHPLPRPLLPDISAPPLASSNLATFDTLALGGQVRVLTGLRAEIKNLRASQINARTQLKRLDRIREQTEEALRPLEQWLGAMPLPVPAGLHEAARTGNTVLKELGVGYADLATRASGRWTAFGLVKPSRVAVLHAMDANARRLRLAYRAYSNGSRSAWAQLHQLYTIAVEQGFAELTCEPQTPTASDIYIRALLLAHAEPTQYAESQLDHLCSYIETHAHLVTLRAGTPGRMLGVSDRGKFLVKRAEPGPGHACAKQVNIEIGAGDLVLDCTGLLEELAHQTIGLGKGTPSYALGLPEAARSTEYAAMLRRAYRSWAGQAGRRLPRKTAHPRVDLTVGLDAIWDFVAGSAFCRRASDVTGSNYVPQVRMSEWSLIDASDSGLALQYAGNDADCVRINELCAVRMRDRRAFEICIVRRALSGKPNELMLGLEVLASQAHSVCVSWEDQATPHEASAVLMPEMANLENAEGLIVPANQMSPGTELSLQHGELRRRMRVKHWVERAAQWEILALEPAVDTEVAPAD